MMKSQPVWSAVAHSPSGIVPLAEMSGPQLAVTLPARSTLMESGCGPWSTPVVPSGVVARTWPFQVIRRWLPKLVSQAYGMTWTDNPTSGPIS